MNMIVLAALLLQASEPRAIPTFECMSLEWDRPAGRGGGCTVEVRSPGEAWRPAHPLWWDALEKQQRGSVVGLTPGKTYEFRLNEGGDAATVTASTWSDRVAVSETVVLPEGTLKEPLIVDAGGSPSGYRVYRAHPRGTTVDVGNAADYGVVVRADRVVVRGLTIRGARIHGIYVENRRDVVIEGCDISGWGRPDPTDDPKKRPDLGAQLDSGIFCEGKDVERIVIQGNRIHHPRYTSNDWSEWSPFFRSNHPQGPKAIVFKPQTRGRHVIRHNTIDSDDAHLFNDILLESNPGWPGNGLNRDSDIYGNRLSHAVDDAVELERGTRNVRVWGNYFDRAGIKTFSVRPCWEGPYYLFRNVVDRAYVPSGRTAYRGREIPAGMFVVGGGRGPAGASAAKEERGVGYVYHNTLLCPDGAGQERFLVGDFPHGLREPERWFVSRNNVAVTRPIRTTPDVPINDFFTERVVADHDLFSGAVDRPAAAGPNCVKGRARWRTGHGSGDGGLYQLAAGSPGHDAGVVLPGFNEGYRGRAPDLGASEEDSPPMIFGIPGWRPSVP
jgi:hypothetical protein